jgi:hypothetical protein
VSGGIKLTSGGFNTSTFVNITDTASSTSTGTGALIVAGGAGIGGAVYAVGVTSSGAIRVTATTASTASNTGAITVAGGVGVAGALNVGARATANAITTATGISFGTGSASIPVPTGDAPMFAVRAWGVATGGIREGGIAANDYFIGFTGANLTYSKDEFDNVYWHVFNFVTPMPDTNYSALVTCQRSSGTSFGTGSGANRNDGMDWAIKVKETNRFAVVTRVDSSTNFQNMQSINVMVIR